MNTLTQHIGQIETAIILIFGLVALNWCKDGKAMTPPLMKQLQIASVTSVSVVLGVWLADVNGLSSMVDGVMKLFLALYLGALLLVLGQLNPVIKPLIDKALSMLDKGKK